MRPISATIKVLEGCKNSVPQRFKDGGLCSYASLLESGKELFIGNKCNRCALDSVLISIDIYFHPNILWRVLRAK